jgi:hypothetical protein
MIFFVGCIRTTLVGWVRTASICGWECSLQHATCSSIAAGSPAHTATWVIMIGVGPGAHAPITSSVVIELHIVPTPTIIGMIRTQSGASHAILHAAIQHGTTAVTPAIIQHVVCGIKPIIIFAISVISRPKVDEMQPIKSAMSLS